MLFSYRNQLIDLQSKTIDWFLYECNIYLIWVKKSWNTWMSISHGLRELVMSTVKRNLIEQEESKFCERFEISRELTQ